PALARPALDQAMNARIDDVDAEDPRDLRDRPPFQPIDPIGQPLWTYLDANPPRVRPLAIIDDHREARPPVLDQPSRLPRPKRAAAADEKTSLQQARLPGAIRPEGVVPFGMQTAVDARQHPETVDSEAFERHQSRPARGERLRRAPATAARRPSRPAPCRPSPSAPAKRQGYENFTRLCRRLRGASA